VVGVEGGSGEAEVLRPLVRLVEEVAVAEVVERRQQARKHREQPHQSKQKGP